MSKLIVSILETGAVPNVEDLQTKAIQDALDKVFIGEWRNRDRACGQIQYRFGARASNTTLYL